MHPERGEEEHALNCRQGIENSAKREVIEYLSEDQAAIGRRWDIVSSSMSPAKFSKLDLIAVVAGVFDVAIVVIGFSGVGQG